MIINRENVGNIHAKINEVLSGLEQEVLNAYLDGKSYQEIAETLGRHVKSIDNALQRVKRKLENTWKKTICKSPAIIRPGFLSRADCHLRGKPQKNHRFPEKALRRRKGNHRRQPSLRDRDLPLL